MLTNEFGTPNWLASKHTIIRTFTAKNTLGCVTTLANGKKVIKSGAVFPANDATAKGIVINYTDVSDHDKPIAVLVEGYVYGDRLPAAIASAASSVLTEIKVVKYNEEELIPLTVTLEQKGGVQGSSASTAIKIDLDKAITGFAATHITIAAGTGSATKGTLSGSGKNYEIGISNVSKGKVKVSITDYGLYRFNTSKVEVDVYDAT